MDCEEPIYKKPSYEDNQAKWQEGRGQMARYLSDVHDSVNSYGYQRNVYGAVAVGKLVEFWKYDYLLQNLTKRHVLSGSPISSLQCGPKCPELDPPTTRSTEQDKSIGLLVMNGQHGVFIVYVRGISFSQYVIPKTCNGHSKKTASNAIHKQRTFLSHLLDIFL